MKLRNIPAILALLVSVGLLLPSLLAQAGPKSANITYELTSEGTLQLSLEMSFDALAWRQWKAQVGDDPSRLRAMMKHQFSAYVIDDFKFEKDDMNRTAKVSMRSPAGPELRKDGRFRLAVEKEYRLVNHTGREWFFSGNNPYANNSLQTVKIVFPPNAQGVTLTSPGGVEQALIYGIDVPAGRSRGLLIGGMVLAVIGGGALAAGMIGTRPSPTPAAA